MPPRCGGVEVYMKCPVCGVENEDRNTCKNCAKFLYNINQKNRARVTPQEKRKNIMKAIWVLLSRTVLIFLILLVLMIVTFLIVLGIQYLTGGALNPT